MSRELNPSSHIGDPPSWASISYQSDAEGSDGALPSHRHVGVNELCPNRACNGHANAPTKASLQRLRVAERVHRDVLEEGAVHQLA